MVEIVGHRGAAAHEPENTLKSFNTAIKLGITTIEFDVHLTRDEKLVVIHDNTVNRTTNGKGHVRDMDLHDIRCLDAGNGERIPTLLEVLDLARGKVAMQIELKGLKTGLPVAELISSQNAANICLISFSHGMLAEVKKAFPKIRTGALLSHLPLNPLAIIRYTGAEMLSINHSVINKKLVIQMQKYGKRICAWTVNEPAEIRRLLRLETDAIVSDAPDLVMKELFRSRQHRGST